MLLAIAIIGAVIYFLFFDNVPQKTKARSNRLTKNNANQNYKNEIPGINWRFQRTIDEPGVPQIINTFRKHLNGKGFEQIIKMVYFSTEVEQDKLLKGQVIMQITEPLLELMKLNYLENYEVENILSSNYEFLINHYSTYGMIGQLKNIQDIYNYLHGIPILEKSLINAFTEIQVRKSILKIIKKEGFISAYDLIKIEDFNKIELQDVFISRLVRSNQIREEKKGKSITYKIVE